jgi:protein ImuB
MSKRFVSIWFPHLLTDWFTIRQPALRDLPFVLSAPSHGRMIISSANITAQKLGVDTGMVLADARAVIPALQVLDDKPGLADKLLVRLAEWFIRFTPYAAVDPPDGLVLDTTGCSHLWGGDRLYLTDMTNRLQLHGYNIRVAISGTVGASWAIARFGNALSVIENGEQMEALFPLPPAALRLESGTIECLHKLGLVQIKDFINTPRPALRRRFGQSLIQRLDQAFGWEEEIIQHVQPIQPYQERLPCLEAIVTATGIEIALQRLLEALCSRLQKEQKGIRLACLKCYKVDGKIVQVDIGTNRPSHNAVHLFKLFETKLSSIQPDLGIELFVLEAPKVEDHSPLQEKIWEGSGGLEDIRVSELIDRLISKAGAHIVTRYLPDEHHWPERSIKPAGSLQEKPATAWRIDRPRPLQLLSRPEPIEVAAPIPDYPPMLFRYKGKVHTIKKADGPERIEREWWLDEGEHRDYYRVEDEEGNRYWVFRSGHYSEDKSWQWFLCGFFA